MPVHEDDYFMCDENSQYGVVFNEYGNKFSLIQGSIGKDGKIYTKWCKHLYGDRVGDRSLPVGTPPCSRDEFINMLEWALKKLKQTGHYSNPKPSNSYTARREANVADDIPF